MRHFILALLGVLLAMGLAAQSPAHAQTQRSAMFEISAGPANQGIAQLARQADFQILAPEADLAGQRTSAVNGRYEPREALKLLLAGTALRISSDTGRVVTVRRASRFPFPVRRAAPVAPISTPPPVVETPLVASQPLAVEEVVVTGSLVVRGGLAAPTPVTVVDAATLQRAAQSNIPDALNQLPQFSGSRSESQNSQTGTAISPTAGNYLNLRNLGIVRSLILLDGQRIPPTSYEGTVDTNIIPQTLVQRVDIVTAGASATYGSDALTGVVNFVLDKRFTGLKASVQGGISEQGDNNSYRLTVAGGAPAADDRAHLLFSLEHYQSDGIDGRDARPLYDLFPMAFGNGTTVPYRTEFNTRVANSTFGGLALTGPLAFMKFEPGGRVTPFDRGSDRIGGVQIGGDGSVSTPGSLIGAVRTEQAFGRASYDLSDNLSAFIEATFGEARNRFAHVGNDSRLGNMTIFSGNAFLRPEVQAALTASGTPSFTFSRHTVESGRKVVDTLSTSGSLFAGLEGRLLGGWTWKLNYSGGHAILRTKHTRNPENTRLTAALDAVRDPSGNIVCRVTLTNPDLFPGCVPINFFGVGAPSQAALQYIYGQDSQYQVRNALHDLAYNATGALFDAPAGPVIAAVGVEYRHQSLAMTSNAAPGSPLPTTGLRGFPIGQGRFGNTNQGTADGAQDVREAFGELVVPLARNLPLIRSLEFNGAARVTDYSTSGQVETWKAGFGYEPFTGLRVRATQSRDIRAPTLYELFAGSALTAGTFDDVHTNQTVVATQIRSGNPDLVPEIGKTWTIGLVWQPAWLSGFSATIDYYDIKIDGAISMRTNTQVNQDCEDSGGLSPSCAQIQRPFPFSDRSSANAVQRISVAPQNQAVTFTHGVDLDAGYRLPLSTLWPASTATLTLRGLVNYAPSYKTRETSTSPIQQLAGLGGAQNTNTGSPKLRSTLSATWERGPLRLSLQQRFTGAMKRSLLPTTVYVDNDIPAVRYYSLAATYDFAAAGAGVQAFLNVSNLLDEDPPLVPYINSPGLIYPTLQQLYDVVGRYYTAGLRVQF